MHYIILHDGSGAVVGRISTSDSNQLKNYVDYVDADQETYDSAPEIWGEIDLAVKKLKAKPGHADPRKKPR